MKYNPDGTTSSYLVHDAKEFEKRDPIIARISSEKAVVFGGSDISSATHRYLVRGDSVMVVEFKEMQGGLSWIKFRFFGKVVTEGWVKCEDVDDCRGL
ncbi:hypothetical protein D3C80_1769840 [compost metagenome]